MVHVTAVCRGVAEKSSKESECQKPVFLIYKGCYESALVAWALSSTFERMRLT